MLDAVIFRNVKKKCKYGKYMEPSELLNTYSNIFDSK